MVKVFGIDIHSPRNEKVYFPVTDDMVRRCGGHIWGLAQKIEQLLQRPRVDGINYICVLADTAQLKIEFDPDLTTAKAVTKWLQDEGLLKELKTI